MILKLKIYKITLFVIIYLMLENKFQKNGKINNINIHNKIINIKLKL